MSEMEDEVFSSPYKPVPQSMIDNVMSICPDVDPKDVAKDLVITGSATRTINRILDGQVSKLYTVTYIRAGTQKNIDVIQLIDNNFKSLSLYTKSLQIGSSFLQVHAV